MINTIHELKTFLILWATQSLSQLGSAMTGFALTLWLYQQTGSALKTALLSISSYAPYVLLSIFAGTLSDRWDKKKTMLACDTLAALCTLGVLVLLRTQQLRPMHLYLLNGATGLMNTVQQPASEVALTLITPRKHYQKTSGLMSFSNSLADRAVWHRQGLRRCLDDVPAGHCGYPDLPAFWKKAEKIPF